MLKFSRTSHVHIVLLKLSNCCCTWRCQTLFHRNYSLTAETSTLLTIRYGRPCMNVFIRERSTAIMNWNSGQFSFGAVLMNIINKDIGQLCKDFRHFFMWKAAISSTPCELIHSHKTCYAWLMYSKSQRYCTLPQKCITTLTFCAQLFC